MNYSLVIQRSWQIMWRHRWLWVLGLLVPGSISFGGNGGGPLVGSPLSLLPTGTGSPNVTQFNAWLEQSTGFLVAAVVVSVILMLALFAVSFIANGGLMWGAAELARDRQVTLRDAWRRGVACGWRFVGLWLIEVAVVLLAIGGVVVLIFGIVGLFSALGVSTGVSIATGVLAAILLPLPLIVLAIAFSVIIVYAQRAIAIDDAGPWRAMLAGLALVRDQPGPSTLAWLIGAGLMIVAGSGLGLLAATVATPLLVFGLVLYATNGLSLGLTVFGIVGLALIVVVTWVASGIVNAYFWTYWTITYLALTDGMAPSQSGAGSPPAES